MALPERVGKWSKWSKDGAIAVWACVDTLGAFSCIYTLNYFFFSSSFGGSGFGVGSLNWDMVSTSAAEVKRQWLQTYGIGLAVMAWSDLFPSLKVGC